MSKEINKYLNLSIVMSVLFAILGVILVVSPNSSLDTIAYLLAAFLLVYGTYNFIDSFAIHPIFFFMKMASSVISKHSFCSFLSLLYLSKRIKSIKIIWKISKNV